MNRLPSEEYRVNTKVKLGEGVYRAPLAQLADFSFRLIPHLGASPPPPPPVTTAETGGGGGGEKLKTTGLKCAHLPNRIDDECRYTD